MASSGPAPAPKLEHFQDCDDLALGRLARDILSGGVRTESVQLAELRSATRDGVRFGLFRSGCQCAALRASAAATYHGKLRKAAAAKGGQ